jgi:hypothetical protein
MKTKIARPSIGYEMTIPHDVCQESEGRVSSFWLDGRPLLLQLSSYAREKGRQVGARTRLKDRITKHSHKWIAWEPKIHPDPYVDQATAEFTDEKGVLWVHSYLVWPHLAIYATISGPEELVSDQDNWAIQGLESVKLVIH